MSLKLTVELPQIKVARGAKPASCKTHTRVNHGRCASSRTKAHFFGSAQIGFSASGFGMLSAIS